MDYHPESSPLKFQSLPLGVQASIASILMQDCRILAVGVPSRAFDITRDAIIGCRQAVEEGFLRSQAQLHPWLLIIDCVQVLLDNLNTRYDSLRADQTPSSSDSGTAPAGTRRGNLNSLSS